MLNQKITNKVTGISYGKLFLLGLYHELDTKIIPHETKRIVNMLKLYDYDGVRLIWKNDIYNLKDIKSNLSDNDGFNWVKDWAKKFKEINNERTPDYEACKNRMIFLFKKHSFLTKELVYKGRDFYFDLLSDPKYLKTPHKFIKEGAGVNSNSMLITYINMYQEKQESLNIKKPFLNEF